MSDLKTVRCRRFDCPQCGGVGWITIGGHNPGCDGSCTKCPVPEQAPCDRCGGAGFFERPVVKIWIDDERQPPDDSWTWAKTFASAVGVLESCQPDAVSFDHDLGAGGTGYDVACAVETMAYHGVVGRFEWDVHSANPVGAERIAAAMRNTDKIWSEQEKEQQN